MRMLLALALLLGSLPLVAEDPSNIPGYVEDLACVGDPSFTIDLIIPADYASDPERQFPAFFLSSAGGDPSITAYRDWADRLGFIVVALNNSRNGPWDNNLKAQDLALQTLAERGLRMHHCLRYAGGASGAGQASVGLVSRLPEHFAGVHISIHSGNGTFALPHQAVTIYAGLNDQTHPWSAVQGAIRTYEAQGNPLHVQTHPGGHDGASPAIYMRDIEWMYWRTLLSHPNLSREDQLASLARIDAEAARIAELSEPSARATAFARLLASPVIAGSPSGKGMAVAWGEAIAAAASAESDAIGRYWILSEASEQAWFRGVDSGLRRDLGKQLKALLKEDAIKAEQIAAQAYHTLEAAAAKANTDSKRADVAAGYRAIVERFGDTRYGRKAAEAVGR
jgi:hypothetical protein